MIEKNDGTKEIKSEWEEPRFPVHQGNVRATALPNLPQVNMVPLPHVPRMRGDIGATESIGVPNPNPRQRGMMQGVYPQASIANIGAPRAHVPRMRGDIGAADSIGMPQVANLRNRVRGIDRQQAAIPRQQMPPPRFVPRVDPSQFPTVQDRNTGTYNLGEPGVQMGGGFDWSGQALRENVGEDLRDIWSPIKERMDNILEDIRKKREGQSMAPFEDVSRGTSDFLSNINPFWGRQPWH